MLTMDQVPSAIAGTPPKWALPDAVDPKRTGTAPPPPAPQPTSASATIN